eukprot:g16432.t1
MEESNAGILLMLLGAVFVLIFQVNLTWLAGLTSVATVGIIGGVKIIPQWIINALFQQDGEMPMNVKWQTPIELDIVNASTGSKFILTSKLVIRWSNQIRHPKIFLRWKPRRAPGLPSDMWTSCSFLSEQFLLDVPTTHK